MTTGMSTNSFLTEIIMNLKSGNIRRCEALGLTIDEIQELNKITVDDLHYITHSEISILSLKINHRELSVLLKQAKIERIRLQHIDRALSLGASIAMMDYFFGLTTSEVSARRRILGIEARQGRVVIPSEEEEIQIWSKWENTIHTKFDSIESLEAMMLISEEMEISLTAIWTSIKSCIEKC